MPSTNSLAPAWNLGTEYDSFDDPRFFADLEEAKAILCGLEAKQAELKQLLTGLDALDPGVDLAALDLLSWVFTQGEALGDRLQNLATYASCVASVDGSDSRAKEYRGVLSSLHARVEAALGAAEILLARAPEPFITALLARPEAAGQAFRVGQLRKYRARLLDLSVESALSSLGPDGHHAWSRLYDAITGTAKAELDLASGRLTVGLSGLASLLRDGDRETRKAAFHAQAATFSVHEESLAAILNALAGWRLSEYRLRSHTEPYHFLDAALAQNRLTRPSLEAMFAAVDEARGLGQRALSLQARLLGVERLAPWDLLAPCPQSEGKSASYSFPEALDLVRRSYAGIHPDMGDFVDSMLKEKRIEARVLVGKKPGAYCTRFRKSRTSWVFQSFGGSLADVFTLAHELGHAYHGSLLAGLHPSEAAYPMNLAETASTFAEAVLAEGLGSEPGAGRARLLEVGWGDAQDAATFLINIPARFAFEKAFYEARAEKPLGPEALSSLMATTMAEYYGDSLSEVDRGFWKSKLHYYMSGRSFYNFPYTFGFLFSLGVYAQRDKLGEGFHGAYKALLMDSGRMESEDLARRHLGVDLQDPEFWRSSIRIVKAKLDRFEALI